MAYRRPALNNNKLSTATLTKYSADSNQLDNFHWPDEDSPIVPVNGGINQKGEKVRYVGPLR